MNLYKRIGIFGVKHYNLGKQFDYFQPYSIKMIYEKKIKIKISALFQPIFNFKLNGKRSGADSS